MDLDSIEPGEDFEAAIERTLAGCEGVVALIGKRWLELKDSKGRQRLSNEDDYVRRELAIALANGIRVVPILLDEAQMPSREELPDDMKLLPTRNAVKTEASRFIDDTNRLMTSFEKAPSKKLGV